MKRKKKSSSYGVEKRWTQRIAENGFTPVASVFLAHYRELNITVPEAMLLVHLVSFKWSESVPFPSMTKLATLMGCTDRYIRKMCQNLESVGFLKRTTRTGMSNQFELKGLFDRLEQFLPAVEEPPPAPPTGVQAVAEAGGADHVRR